MAKSCDAVKRRDGEITRWQSGEVAKRRRGEAERQRNGEMERWRGDRAAHLLRGQAGAAYRPTMRAFVLLALASLAACGQPDEAAYPRLLPLSQLNAPPAIPAHAADAAADPQAVGDALQARRAQTRDGVDAISGPAADAAALSARARALQSRADALQREPAPPAAATAPNPPAATPAHAPATPAQPDTDPALDARIQRLRDRAGALSARPAADSAPLPLCPPGAPAASPPTCRSAP